MSIDHAAPLKPRTRRVWIVRWVRADGHETRHRVYLTRHHAARFHDVLLDGGRDAAMFTTDVDWHEVNP